MKISILFLVLSILIFSCTGTPENYEQLPINDYDDIENETYTDKHYVDDYFDDTAEAVEETPVQEPIEDQVEIAQAFLDDGTYLEDAHVALTCPHDCPHCAALEMGLTLEDIVTVPEEAEQITELPPEAIPPAVLPAFEELAIAEPEAAITEPEPEPQIEPPAVEPQPVQPPPLLALPPAPPPLPPPPPPLPEPAPFIPVPPSTRVVDPLPQMGVVPRDEDIVFSRVVRLMVGQILEIPFRGNGWVFLGELSSRRGVVFNSRRVEPEGMSFIFNTQETGTFILRFFREDFTRNFILHDYVQVIVSEATAAVTGWFNQAFDRSRVVAQPRWPSALQEAEIVRGRQALPFEQGQTAMFSPGNIPHAQDAAPAPPAVTPPAVTAQPLPPATAVPPITPTVTPAVTAPPVVPPQPVPQPPAFLPPQQPAPQPEFTPPEIAEAQEHIPPHLLLQRAREALDAGNIAAAIALLDLYMQYFPNGCDEAFWLYGRAYEANSPSRNILRSLNFYRRLVNEFPQSAHLTEARRRIAHLERFFIHIQ